MKKRVVHHVEDHQILLYSKKKKDGFNQPNDLQVADHTHLSILSCLEFSLVF